MLQLLFQSFDLSVYVLCLRNYFLLLALPVLDLCFKVSLLSLEFFVLLMHVLDLLLILDSQHLGLLLLKTYGSLDLLYLFEKILFFSVFQFEFLLLNIDLLFQVLFLKGILVECLPQEELFVADTAASPLLWH